MITNALTNKIVTILSIIIGVEACIVLCGWIFSIDYLVHQIPGSNDMKFSTAVAFLLSAVGLYYINKNTQRYSGLSQVILPAIALSILLIMVSFLASWLVGAQSGLENLFIIQHYPSIGLSSGLPSLFTAIGFTLFGFAILAELFQSSKSRASLKYFGFIIMLIGLCAVAGYIVHMPVLYYQLSTNFTPMSLNAALSFVLLGVGLIIVSITNTNYES